MHTAHTTRFIQHLAAIAVLTSSLSGCAQGHSDSQTSEGGGAVNHEQVAVSRPQTLSTYGHSVTITPPPNFSGSTQASPFGQMMILSGPKHSDGKCGVMMLTLLKIPKDKPISPEQVVDTTLKPFKEHFNNYKEAPIKSFTDGKHVFVGKTFGGVLTVRGLKGVVYATLIDDCVLSVQAQDTASEFMLEEPQFLSAIHTILIMK